VTLPLGGIFGRTSGAKGACGVRGLRSRRCETNIHSRARRGSNQWMIRPRGVHADYLLARRPYAWIYSQGLPESSTQVLQA
jgi:hypothetical protein